MKYWLAIAVIIFMAGCQRQPVTAELGGKTFRLELAQTPAAWQQGLSKHAPLTSDQAMLFIFPDRQVRRFWMKDMGFPLDIVWLDGGRIAGISPDLVPEGSEPTQTYASPAPVDRVLELPAGTAQRLKLQIGDPIVYHL